MIGAFLVQKYPFIFYLKPIVLNNVHFFIPLSWRNIITDTVFVKILSQEQKKNLKRGGDWSFSKIMHWQGISNLSIKNYNSHNTR